MKTRDFRIILFAAIVATTIFSGAYTSKYYARPLYDEHITLITIANPTSYSTVGQQITYSFLITNISPDSHAISQIVITDNLVKNISCPANSLNPGESMTCTGIYIITQGDINKVGVYNRTSLSGGFNIPKPPPPRCFYAQKPKEPEETVFREVSAIENYRILSSVARSDSANDHIMLTTTGNPTSYSTVGEQITYSFQITNISPDDRSYRRIVIVDTLIKNILCPVNHLDPGENYTCTGDYIISQEDINRGNVFSQTLLSGEYYIALPPRPGGSSMCGGPVESTTYTVYAKDDNKISLSLAKPEIHLEKTGSPNVFVGAGEQITYTYAITNTGTIALEGPISVQDNWVAVTCPAGGLAVGTRVECTATYTTTEEDVARGSITNTALASVSGTNSQEATFQIELDSSAESADISLIKSTDPANHSYKGELVIYIFNVTNTGSVPLTSPFTINDPKLDELICTPPEQLSMGGSFECRGYYRVREFDIGKTINNCASVSGMYQGQTITSAEACANIPYQAGGQPPPAPDSDPDPEPDADPDTDDDND